MRTISDYLATKFAALGLPAVSDHQLFEGQQVVTFGDGTRIFVGAFASDAEIEAATRKAFNMTETTEPAPEAAPTPSADKLPAVEVAPAAQKPKADAPKLGGVMSKGYKPGSLKALLDGLHRDGQSLMQDIANEVAQVKEAYGRARRVKDDLREHREGIMSELGQFSNFADDDGE